MSSKASVAVIGGSGLYALAGLDEARSVTLETPFGAHSEGLIVGRLGDRSVAFLARHGKGHELLPAEINYRANVFALKSLGVERILSASAVGSMREGIHPRDLVLVDQFIDRGQHRQATFFGDGIAAHIGFADPVCPHLRGVLGKVARTFDAPVHDGGTYLCMEGPAFSTRAESRLYRSWGVDVIGMTNMHEAKLAREAEICYATMALVTDYDCWNEAEDDVAVGVLLDNLRANAQLAAQIVRDAVGALPETRSACDCAGALEHAIITAPESISPEVRTRLGPILSKYVPLP